MELTQRLWTSVRIQDPKRNGERKAQIRFTEIPTRDLLNTLHAIRGGVAVHAERAARLCGAWRVQDGAECGNALLPRRRCAAEERLQQRECLATPLWDCGDGTKKSMCGEEIGAHHLRAAAAAPAAHATLEGLKCSARLSLRRWACGRIGEWLGDGNGSVESFGNLLGDLLRARIRRVGDGNDANLQRFVAAAQHEPARTGE